MNLSKNKYFGEANLVFITLIWAGTFTLIKTALDYTSPMLFVGIRFGTATLLMLPFVYKKIIGLDKTAYKEGFILGFLFFAGFALQTLGLEFTTATKSAFITGTFVVFTPVFQTIIEKKFPKPINIVSIALVFIGIVILSSKGDSYIDILYEVGSSFNLGDFLTLLCAIAFSIYMVYMDVVSPKHDVVYLTFAQLFTTSVLAFGFAQLMSWSEIQEIYFTYDHELLGSVLYTAVLASIVATGLQTKYQRVVTPTKAGLLFSMEPIFAAIIAYLVLHETISVLGLTGSIFIFGGLVISEVFKG